MQTSFFITIYLFIILNNKQKNHNPFHYFCFILSAKRFKLRKHEKYNHYTVASVFIE
jgi:hypothetical protein